MTAPVNATQIRGQLDGLYEGRLEGWAMDVTAPESPVYVEIVIDDEVVGRALANRFRTDLQQAGIGNGRCAFALSISTDDWSDGAAHEIHARALGTQQDLGGSPIRVVISDLAPAPASARPLAKYAADTVLGIEGSRQLLRQRLARSGRLALVASFQPPSPAPSHLTKYLEAFRELDAAVVLIDTTPGGLPVHPDLAQLVVYRENVGWDFASWLAGIDQVRDMLGDVNELVLANDSVIGPLYPLRETWGNPRLEGADFWGLTDSWSISYHLQSYFLVLRRRALDHPALWDFLETYPFPVGKREVIREGEVRLTTTLRRAGLRSAVTCPYEEVARVWLDDLGDRLERVGAYPENVVLDRIGLDPAVRMLGASASIRRIVETAQHIRQGLPLNPTHYFWDTLVEKFRHPFVKRDLLLSNPVEIPLATEVARVVSAAGYDPEHIRDAARRIPGVRVVTV